MYDPRQILKQTPENVKWLFMSALGLFGAWRGWAPDLIDTLGVGLFVERLLQALYVNPTNNVKQAAQLVALDKVITGTEPVPPMPEPKRRLRPLKARRN